MVKKEGKEKLEKGIDYLKIHLESIDKTNIEIAISKISTLFTVIMGCFVALFLGILSLNVLNILWKVLIDIIIVGFLFFLLRSVFRKSNAEIVHHNLSLKTRERMIQERYNVLYGVSKDDLNKEFEELKTIYKNPTAVLIGNLVNDYYKKNPINN